jgi:hypothetical protein
VISPATPAVEPEAWPMGKVPGRLTHGKAAMNGNYLKNLQLFKAMEQQETFQEARPEGNPP